MYLSSSQLNFASFFCVFFFSWSWKLKIQRGYYSSTYEKWVVFGFGLTVDTSILVRKISSEYLVRKVALGGDVAHSYTIDFLKRRERTI